MMNNFLLKTTEFIQKSGIDLKYPFEADKIKISENGTKEMYVSFTDEYCGCKSLLNNPLLQISNLFLLFDVFIDAKYNGLQGNTYGQKYNSLPSTTDIETVQKEIFRILKIFRNSLTHNISSISLNGNQININYSFHQTNFSLIMDIKILDDIFTIVMMLINGVKNYREECYLKHFFQNITNTVQFNDEFGNTFTPLVKAESLNIYRQEITLVPNLYKIDTTHIEIQCETGDKNGVYQYDYLFDIVGNKFLIPIEAMNSNKISLADAEKWKI